MYKDCYYSSSIRISSSSTPGRNQQKDELQVAFETGSSFSDGFQNAKRYSTGLDAMDGGSHRQESSVLLLEIPQAGKGKTGEKRAKKAKTRSIQTLPYLPCVLVRTVVLSKMSEL